MIVSSNFKGLNNLNKIQFKGKWASGRQINNLNLSPRNIMYYERETIF